MNGPIRIWFAFFVVYVRAATAQDPLVIRDIHFHPRPSATPFELSWTAVPGERYEVLATSALGNSWVPLTLAPITATTSTGSFVDSEFADRRFYRVMRLAYDLDPNAPGLEILPSHAALAPGQVESFTVSLPRGETAMWLATTLAGGDAGRISPGGVYTAPGTVPDPPYVVVQATGTKDPKRGGLALVTLSRPEDLRISREQAVRILQTQVIAQMPSPARTVALGLQDPVGASDELRPARGLSDGTSVVAGAGAPLSDPPLDAWFFLVDPTPGKAWSHLVRYVYVDARTGSVTSQLQEWFPLLNGYPLWARIEHRKSSPDLVFIGSEFQSASRRDSETGADAGTLSLAAPTVLPWASIFTNTPAGCACTEVNRYALVIADDSPATDPNPFTWAANAATGVFDQDTEERMLHGGQLMAETLQAAGFQVTSLLGGANTHPTKILTELRRFHTVLKPCDIFVLYHTGHGSKEGIGRFGYVQYARYLPNLHTPSKYVIIDSCYAANILGFLAGKNLIPAVVLAATDPNTAGNVFFDAPVYDRIKRRKPLAFTNGLLLCAATSPSVPLLHGCVIALDEEIADCNPVLQSVGASADTDGDGVADRLEVAAGLDPARPDSDSDGACDGVELAAIPLAAGGSDPVHARPQISANSLPLAPVLVDYSASISLLATGQPYNANPAGPSNPHGFGPANGWFVDDGALPAGLGLDRQTGIVSGRTVATGIHLFTIRYTDAIGSSARQELSLEVGIQPNASQPVITVSTAADVNARDDHISLREAVLLASGDLPVSELRPDLAPNNGIPEGELRWISGGIPGASSADSVELPGTLPRDFVLGSPLVVNGSDDRFNLRLGSLSSTASSLVIVNGDRNLILPVGTWQTPGSGIELRGHDNVVISLGAPGTAFRSLLVGSGPGDGILITGNNSSVRGLALSGFENAVRVHSTNNVIELMQFTGNVNAIHLGPGACGNLVSRCAIGYFHDQRGITPGANTGTGVLIRDGARHNRIQDCGIGGNAGAGILITGTGTEGNQVLKGVVGSIQRSLRIGPNGAHGIVIRDGAARNRVAGTELNINVGHGILLSGDGTSLNDLGSADSVGVTITQTEGPGSGIQVENGASSNLLSIRVLQCAGDAIALHGAGTTGNQVTTRDASGVLHYPTDIRRSKGAAVRISGGARGNLLDQVRVNDCDLGIVVQGAGTEENRLVGTTGDRNLGPVILLTGGCRFNSVESPGAMSGNLDSAIVISGPGTSYNSVSEGNMLALQLNGRYMIEIADGASLNDILHCTTYGQKLGGIHLTGRNTMSNRVMRTTIFGGFTDAVIALSGHGIVLDDGARANAVTDCHLSRNGRGGLLISGPETSRNRVAGTRFEANRGSGVMIDNSRDNVIGKPGDPGNVFIGAVDAAVRISGPNASSNRVIGNVIGGLGSSSNRSHAVLIDSGAHHNRIGGARSRQPKFETTPEVPVPLRDSDHAAGNLIRGNSGDGIRIDGAHSNIVAGNLVGFSNPDPVHPGNGGNGIALLNGSRGNCIGDCGDQPKYSNQINGNGGAGVLVHGAGSVGNSVLRNSIFDNLGGHILLREGANHDRPTPSAEVDAVAARIHGTADVPGYVELFSTFIDDPGVFHLRAFVQKGDYTIDQLKPALSSNAVLIQSPRPIRLGDQFLTFTAAATGETSEAIVLNKD